MTRLGTRQLWCVAAMILGALPLVAQSSVLAPVPASNAIPEGQTFLIKLNDKLDTAKLKQGNSAQAGDVDQALRRLTAPETMGTLFKALALTVPESSQPAGFA